MKLQFSALALAIAISFTLVGCGQYEEGPLISLRSKADRIDNTWTVDYAVDADGDNQIDIQISYPLGGSSINSDETLEILKLTNTEFWVRDIDDDRLELHFAAQE